jgi:hypothetical protein
MKISEKPTEHILVRAHVNSEWDSCNSCLVCVRDSYLKRWEEWNEKATQQESTDSSFLHSCYSEDSEFLYLKNTDPEWNTIENLADEIPEDKHWMFVEIGDEDEELGVPEQKIQSHMIKMYGKGGMCFVAYGKNTGEEFFTETISLADIINTINSYQ